MNTTVDILLGAASQPILPLSIRGGSSFLSQYGGIGRELFELLSKRNGFFAFESALHVYPYGNGSPGSLLTLEEWNKPSQWRNAYGSLISDRVLFFGQDVYGNQFALEDGVGVQLFYSEFAEFEVMSKSLEEWAKIVTNDWRSYSGYDLAHEWQIANGVLQEGERLLPKIPFVLGGKYEIANLYAGQIKDAMLFRASLANQLVNVPDGTDVQMRIQPST